MIPLIPFITPGFGWVKTAIVSALTGWLAGSSYSIALQAPPPVWYESPLMIAVVTAISVVMVQVLINLSDRRRQRLAKAEKEGEQHSTFTTRMEELKQSDRKEAWNEMVEAYEQKIKFEQDRRRVSDLQAVEARFRHHSIANALSTAQTHIFLCHGLMSKASIELPPFTPKTDADFEEGLQQAIESYKKRIEDEIHKTAG